MQPVGAGKHAQQSTPAAAGTSGSGSSGPHLQQDVPQQQLELLQQPAAQAPAGMPPPGAAGADPGPSSSSSLAPAAGGSGVQRYADSFMMYVWKVEMCKRVDKHAREQCPYAHPGELARRRHPSLYQALPCPEARAKKICPRLDNCNCSHSTFEFWLHPDRYKTFLCERGADCDRPICFFAHGEGDLRELPEGLQRTKSTRKLGHYAGSSSSGAGGGRGRLPHHPAALPAAGSAQLQAPVAGVMHGQLQGAPLFVQGGAATQMSQQQQQQRGVHVGPQQVLRQQQQGLPQHSGGHMMFQQGIQQLQVAPRGAAEGGPDSLVGSSYQPPMAFLPPGGGQAGGAGMPGSGSMFMVHPARRSSTVAVIPCGPSAWQGSNLVSPEGEAPSLEALCAAMHRMATPRPEAPQQLLFGFQQQQQQQPLPAQQQQPLQVQMLVPVQQQAGSYQPHVQPLMHMPQVILLAPAGRQQQPPHVPMLQAMPAGQQQQQPPQVPMLQAMPAGQQQQQPPQVPLFQAMPAGQQQQQMHVMAVVQQPQQMQPGPDPSHQQVAAGQQLVAGEQVMLMVAPDGSQQLGWSSSQQQHG